METVKLLVLFLLCGLLMSVFGYGIDGAEAAFVFGLYFGPLPVMVMVFVACLDSLHCRYRRWRRTWNGIILI